MKPEARLEAGLAPAGTGRPAPPPPLPCLHPARLLQVGDPERPEQVGSGHRARAAVGPQRPSLALPLYVSASLPPPRTRDGAPRSGSRPSLTSPPEAMLPRGRPRALGAAALLLLLLLGFFLFSRDLDGERGHGAGRCGCTEPLGVLMPRVSILSRWPAAEGLCRR